VNKSEQAESAGSQATNDESGLAFIFNGIRPRHPIAFDQFQAPRRRNLVLDAVFSCICSAGGHNQLERLKTPHVDADLIEAGAGRREIAETVQAAGR